jgi:YspA, cpYpsA-related SLOG family
MKTIIAGSRTINNLPELELAIKESGIQITEVICGGANGVDKLGEKWAKDNNVPIKYFLPNWEQFGKAAGPIRNSQMIDYAEAAIILWDGISRGTLDTITKANSRTLKSYIKIIQ